jgi:hypothetical protein
VRLFTAKGKSFNRPPQLARGARFAGHDNCFQAKKLPKLKFRVWSVLNRQSP